MNIPSESGERPVGRVYVGRALGEALSTLGLGIEVKGRSVGVSFEEQSDEMSRDYLFHVKPW